ncbi:hypothetical protein HDE_06432 [Halotydeus destructor]|nr:hypothetical protein HDE_06432 [Halotydeus destructor]
MSQVVEKSSGDHHGRRGGKCGRQGAGSDSEGEGGRRCGNCKSGKGRRGGRRWAAASDSEAEGRHVRFTDAEDSDVSDNKWSRRHRRGRGRGRIGESTKISCGKFKAFVRIMGYHKEDLEIKVASGWLVVSGKHQETSEDGVEVVARQFEKKFKLPENAKVDQIKNKLGAHGRRSHMLKVIIPLDEQPQDVPVHVVVAPASPAAMEG